MEESEARAALHKAQVNYTKNLKNILPKFRSLAY
jgi:hypothetical protein